MTSQLQGNLVHLTDGAVVADVVQSLNELHGLRAHEMTSFYAHVTRVGFLGDAFFVFSKFR